VFVILNENGDLKRYKTQGRATEGDKESSQALLSGRIFRSRAKLIEKIPTWSMMAQGREVEKSQLEDLQTFKKQVGC